MEIWLWRARESKSLRSEVFNVTDIVDSCEYDSLFAFQMDCWVFLLLKSDTRRRNGKNAHAHKTRDDMIVKLDGIDHHRSVICTNDVIGIGIMHAAAPRHGV